MIELYCDNKALMQELNNKEELFSKITERIMRCSCCHTGHFIFTDDGSDYPTFFWECEECGYNPNQNRLSLIEDIVIAGTDEYWDYEVFMFVQNFEYGEYSENNHQEQKKRDFNVAEWNKENNVKPKYNIVHSKPITSWEDYVEDTIREHIKALDTAISRAKNVPMLKKIFKEEK